MDTTITPTEMAHIYKTDKSKLAELGVNTRNIRSTESITIVPITEGGSEFDSEGNRLGFQLGDFQCSQAYRSEFNSYVSGLLTINGPKVHFSTLEDAPIITTWKTEIEEGGEAKYWIVDGNTRISIAKQLDALLGDDFTATIHYTHYKGNLSGLALMYAAPTLGYNSKVPVIVEDTVQAVKYFKELMAKGASVKEALTVIKETFLKSKEKNPTGWSTAKLSYCSTTLALGVATGVLADSTHLNTEFSCVYLRYWYTKVTGQKYRVGDEVTDEARAQMVDYMSKLGVMPYVQSTGRTADFRITSDSAWSAYTAWVEAATFQEVLEEVQEEAQEEVEEVEPAPITTASIEGLSENLKALVVVVNGDSRELASKAMAPLTTAIEAIAHSNPALLASILEAAAKALDTVDAESVAGFSASKYNAALNKASKLNKAARK